MDVNVTPRVSAVTYVKNDVSHIEKCMRSVMAQDMEDMEYIVVDGGSTDGTLDVINRLASEDSRIRIVNTTPGLGHQLNEGIKHAKGEYIGICESDDYLMPGMFSYQYEIAHRYDVDILRADAYDFFTTEDGEYKLPFRLSGVADLRGRLLCDGEEKEAIRMGVNRFFSGLYRREFLVDNELYMNETPGAAYQDNTFAFLTLIKAKRIYISDKPFYCYCLDNPNASSNSSEKINLVDNEYRLMAERLKKSGDWDEYKETYFSWLILNHLWFCNLLPHELRDKEINIFYNAVKELTDSETFRQDKLRNQDIEVINAITSSKDAFCDYINRICDRIEDGKDKINALASDNKVIIFGVGNIGRIIFATLKSKGITPIAFADNNKTLWNTSIEGVNVVAPDSIADIGEDTKIVVANVEHNAEIQEQLISYGISRDRLIICDSYDYAARKILMRNKKG